MKKTPKYLYHYTSLQTLALILKGRKIKFNSLSNMDDLQEKRAKNSDDYGRFFFVSSWTAEKKESIPMWHMYTKGEDGVRIRLPINPFIANTSVSDLNKMHNVTDSSIENDMHGIFFDYLYFLGEGILPEILKEEGSTAIPVKYTNDIDLLEPKVIVDNGDGYTYHSLGLCKNKYWKFQKEWRYIIKFHSFASKERVGNLDVNGIVFELKEWNQKTLDGSVNIPFSCWFLQIDDKCFQEMEITKSPKMTKGNEILLESLVSRYNPTAKIKESDLKNLI